MEKTSVEGLNSFAIVFMGLVEVGTARIHSMCHKKRLSEMESSVVIYVSYSMTSHGTGSPMK